MQMFAEGGFSMWMILGCTLVTHPLALGAVIAAFASKRRGMALGLSGAALLLALMTASVGIAGYVWSMSQVEAAIGSGYLDPTMVEALREQGEREASWNWMCGAAGAALPVLLALVGLVRSATLRADASSPRG